MSNEKPTFLVHYASKYYDPQKAHEYHMKNRELKGRTSTKGMSDDQKLKLQYVKKALNDEKKQVLDTRKDQYKDDRTSASEQRKSEIERMNGQTQSKVSALQEKLANMSPYYRAHNAERIKKEIADLRTENESKKKDLAESFKSKLDALSETYKNDKDATKQEYLQKYYDEYDKIKKSSGDGSKRSASETNTKIRQAFDKAKK